MYAAGFGHVALTQLLLEKGANKDATDQFGKTAKTYAEEYGKADTAALL